MIDIPALAPLNDFIAEISDQEAHHPGAAEVVFALLLSFGLNCLIATLYAHTATQKWPSVAVMPKAPTAPRSKPHENHAVIKL